MQRREYLSMATEKVLVVVSVLEARHFSRCPDSSLVVEGRLNGEVLSTDPVPQSRPVIQVQTELAWEMEPKALQQHKLHRTPVKVQVFTVDNATSTRKLIGYVLLDLRTAQSANKALSQWHKVLNASSRGPCPELCLALSVEEQGEEEKGTEEKCKNKQGTVTQQPQQVSDHKLTLTLNASGGFYSLGPPSPHQQLFVLSVVLDNPENLPQPTGGTGCYYFYYNLLGNDITSELFEAERFKTEKASIRIMSTRERLSLLFESQEDIKICVRQNDATLGEGCVSLKSLCTQDYLESRVEITSANLDSVLSSFVGVKVQLKNETLTPSSPYLNEGSQDLSGHSLFHSHSDSKCDSIAELNSFQSSVCGSGSTQPLKRNLTLSFEEVSDQNCKPEETLPIPESPQEPGHKGKELTSPSSIRRSPDPSTEEFPRSHSLPRSPDRYVSQHTPDGSRSTASPVKAVKESSPAPNFHPFPTLPTSLPPFPERSCSTTLFPTHVAGASHAVLDNVSVSTTCTLPQIPTSHAGTVLSSANTQPLTNVATLVTSEPPSKTIEDTTQYQYSIDIHSIHNVQLGDGLKCYLKYSYPYFGSPCSVMVQPPVSLPLGAEQHFAASFYAFKFAASQSNLMRQLHLQPLSVEVWASREEENDILVGIAKIPLGEVFTGEKVNTVGNVTQLKCSLKVPVMAPLLFQITCAYIHCILVLEDYGPLQLTSEREEHINSSHKLSATTEGLPSSSEYLAAMELEMWKLSQEEAFGNQLRTKEREYLHKLGEEWRKREAERQKVFTQTMERYNDLEEQLQVALKSAQQQQKQLVSRESEIQHLSHKLAVDRKSMYSDCDSKLQQFQMLYEGKLSAERSKAEELLGVVERLKIQVSELSNRLSSRDVEFDSYRQQVLSKPESKLQAELTMIAMEKSELERKLSAALKSKQHYKDQWTRTLKELTAYRQKEQASAREMLQRQQQELECMRAAHMRSEEQRSICQQLDNVKDEVSRLQKDTHSSQGTHVQSSGCPTSTSEVFDSSVNSCVARWVEERDILLQTGVYTHSDLTIQKLDEKIKAALNP